MKTISLSITLAFIAFFGYAQTGYFEERISNKDVYVMAMDGDIIWLGGIGGIGRFNKQSEEFSNFNIYTDSSIQGIITSLVGNSAGELYAIGNGVINYTDNIWYRYTNQNSNLPSYDGPSYVAIDKDNKIWAGWGEYMCRLENNSWQNYQLPTIPVLAYFYINAVEFDSENTAWVGTSHGLYKIVNDTVEQIEELSFHDHIKSLKVMGDYIIMGTYYNGLQLYHPADGKLIEYNSTNSNLPSNWVQNVFPFEESILLTAGRNLLLFEDGDFTVYMDKDSILYNLPLLSIMPDGDVIWLGTRDGLYKYNLTTNTCEKKIISNMPFRSKIRPFCVDTLGTMYQLHSNNPGALRITDADGSSVKTVADLDFFKQNYNNIFTSDTFNVFEKNQVLINFYQVDRRIVSYDSNYHQIVTIVKEDHAAIANNNPHNGDYIKTDPDNDIYKASVDGGYLMYDGNWTSFTQNSSAIPTTAVSNFCFNNTGTLWFSALPEVMENEVIPSALLSYDGSEHQALSITDIPGLNDSTAFISCIYIDSSDVLWLGISELFASGVSHGYGLFSYDGDSWTNYNTDNSGLSGNTINCINAYGSELYIGTSGGGISIYDPAADTWRTFTTDNSLLPWNTVHSIDFDSSDSMYIYHYWDDVLKTGLNIEVSQKNREIESFEDEIIVFPNPTNDMLRIKTPGLSAGSVKRVCIYSVSGKLVAIKDKPDNQGNMTSISLKEYSIKSGMYFVEIITDRKTYMRNIILYN